MRIILLASGLFLLMNGTAQACAVLEKANPRVGSTVSGPLDDVHLRFSMQVFPADSTVAVLNANGQPMSFGKPFADPTDNTTLAIAVRSLPPGRYKVAWNVFAACGSYEPGDFKFTVVPPGTTPTTQPGAHS